MYLIREPTPLLRAGRALGRLVAVLVAFNGCAMAYDLDTNSTDSIKSIAKDMADDMLSFYKGNQPGQTPGLLPDPYYWWEAGAMMGALVDYWYYTDDSDYVDLTKQALLFQVGDFDDYMPRNQTLTEGNDDQGFWGLAVMSAAEYNFPDPKADEPSWLGLAQAVFNTQASRWDPDCNGGLRWQIFTWNKGFNYKNSISQACFFALGARLALFTGNQSYADWADKTWDWMWNIDFIEHDTYYVYDGAHVDDNCTKITKYQFSYNAGGFILGAAAMYNYTESQVWKDRLDKLVEGAKVFFTGPDKNLMTEVACEPVDRCNIDQQSFKAYLSRWLAAATQWAPHTYEVIMPLLEASAKAAAKQCVGGANKRMCGLKWNQDKYDGSTGVGQQMAAMEVTLSTMIKERKAPKTIDTGGTSRSDPGAGGNDIGRSEPNWFPNKITPGERAGAAFATVALLALFLTGLVWICLDETSDKSGPQQIRDFSKGVAATAAAVAAGGGTAALLGRKKPEEEWNEKNVKAANLTSDVSSGTSGVLQGPPPQPAVVGSVRNENQGHQRRSSNMPRGWPHNPSLRASVVPDPNGTHPPPGAFSRNTNVRSSLASLPPVESVAERSETASNTAISAERTSRFTEKLGTSLGDDVPTATGSNEPSPTKLGPDASTGAITERVSTDLPPKTEETEKRG